MLQERAGRQVRGLDSSAGETQRTRARTASPFYTNEPVVGSTCFTIFYSRETLLFDCLNLVCPLFDFMFELLLLQGFVQVTVNKSNRNLLDSTYLSH